MQLNLRIHRNSKKKLHFTSELDGGEAPSSLPPPPDRSLPNPKGWTSATARLEFKLFLNFGNYTLFKVCYCQKHFSRKNAGLVQKKKRKKNSSRKQNKCQIHRGSFQGAETWIEKLKPMLGGGAYTVFGLCCF